MYVCIENSIKHIQINFYFLDILSLHVVNKNNIFILSNKKCKKCSLKAVFKKLKTLF